MDSRRAEGTRDGRDPDATRNGIKRIGVVANRVASEADLAFVRTHLSTPQLLGTLPADPGLECEAREGSYTKDRPFHREMARIAGMLSY